jgi:hypothetical protein
MAHLVRSAARPVEAVSAEPMRSTERRGVGIGRLLTRIVVRVLLALGLTLLAVVFLEAWLPGVVVQTLGSWLPG